MIDKHEFRIVITPFCNYRCFFCHNEGFVEEYTPLLLSPRDYGFVIRTAKKLWGWDTVTITGGEPLISPIYRETCELMVKEGIKITTVTNASLVSSPKKILANNSQLNISLHTMNPVVYKKITCTSYPLDQVINSIVAIRSEYPDMIIHLNSTVIRGMNDDPADMNDLIKFAGRIGGEAKFINLASSNQNLVVPIEEIEERLLHLGMEKVDESAWQSVFKGDQGHVIVTRCGFAKDDTQQRGVRNLFLNPDGTISHDGGGGFTINLLREIHEQNIDGFAKKVEWYFPPAVRV